MVLDGQESAGERYEPDIRWGGRMTLLAIVVLVLAASLGWLFV